MRDELIEDVTSKFLYDYIFSIIYRFYSLGCYSVWRLYL